MSRHGKVMAPLLGRPKVGQHVMVERFYYRGRADSGDRYWFEQGVVEVVRDGVAVVRSVHHYELTVPWTDLRVLVKNFSKRWTRRRQAR